MLTRQERLVRRAASAVLLAALLSLVWPQTLGGALSFAGVDGDSMLGTYLDGDLVVLRAQRSYEVGDVITYRIPDGAFGAGAHVIHRIVAGNGRTGYTTRGDNRTADDEWRPRDQDVVGRSWFRVPGGSARLAWLAQPVHLGALCAALTVGVALAPGGRAPERADGDAPAGTAPPAGQTGQL